ncbi:MAG TPA: hypothetical protein VJK53_00155, partial [Candidatus Paceibacterota bacterium]
DMILILSIVLAIIGWFILMLLTTNLLGLFVRAFFVSDPVLDTIDKLEHEKEISKKMEAFLASERKEQNRANIFVNLTILILVLGFYYLLFYFLNIIAVVAAVMLMAGRLPDLLWEIKHGRKINVRELPKNWVYWTTSLLDWVSLLVFLYALIKAGYISF